MEVVAIYTNSNSGLLSFRKELIEALAQKYSVLLILPNEDRIDEFLQISNNISCVFVRSNNPVSEFISLYKIVKIHKPDILLTYTIKPNVFGAVVGGRFQLPVIVNITGIGRMLQGKSLRSILFRTIYRLSLMKVNYIFFQNHANFEYFQRYKIGINVKSSIIPGSGVNIEKFYPRSEYKTPITSFLFLGRLMKDKGIYELLKAAELVHQGNRNFRLHIAGTVKDKNIIRMLDREYIRFYGRLKEVSPLIDQSDCIVNPSYHEGMSNVLLEASAMGKVCIASDIPGCKEIIVDGKNGFLFQPKSARSVSEAMLEMINLDVDALNIMSKNAREHIVLNFNRNIIIEKYLEVIEKFI